MNNSEKIDNFLLRIIESDEFKKVAYLCFSMRIQLLRFLTGKGRIDNCLFLYPLIESIDIKFKESELDVEVLLEYLVDADKNGWIFHWVMVHSYESCKDGNLRDIKIESKDFYAYIAGYILDYFNPYTIDIRKIINEEIFAYDTNDYKLSKINGAIFEKDGLLFDGKFYLYNIFTDVRMLGPADRMPAFAKIITDEVIDGDILYRLDERLALPENEALRYTPDIAEKFYGPQFNFTNSPLQNQRTIIVHIDPETMNKLLLVVKKREDDADEEFWNVEIETIPYIDITKYKAKYVITTFLHGIYYPNKDIFTHIDYIKNNYDLNIYLEKYADCKDGMPIDTYTHTKEEHYKIWCIENGHYNREVWYKLMTVSLSEKYQVLLDEIIN